MEHKELQEKLNECKLLCFRKGISPTSLYNCLVLAIEGEPTYYADTKRLQCESYRSRGFADLYRICKYYYPNLTVKELTTTLNTVSSLHKFFCGDTAQDVFNINPYGSKDTIIRTRTSSRKTKTVEIEFS